MTGISSTTFNPLFQQSEDLFPEMATLREMASNFQKLDKFEGVRFRQWQKKMHFFLTTLKVVYVINIPYPVETENETLNQAVEDPSSRTMTPSAGDTS